MPIRFRCVYCNQLLGIARRKAGTIVSCPHCGERLIVPTPEQDEAPVEPEPPGEARSTTPAPNKPQRPAPVQRDVSGTEAPAQSPSPARPPASELTKRQPAQVPAQPLPPQRLPAQPARAVSAPPPAAVLPPPATATAPAPASPPSAPERSPAVRLFEQSDIAKLLLADLNAENAEAAANIQPGPGKIGRRPGSNQPEETAPSPDAHAISSRTISISIKLATLISVATVLSLAFSFMMGVLVGRFLLR